MQQSIDVPARARTHETLYGGSNMGVCASCLWLRSDRSCTYVFRHATTVCLTSGPSVTVVPPSSFPTIWTFEILHVGHTLGLLSACDVIITGTLCPCSHSVSHWQTLAVVKEAGGLPMGYKLRTRAQGAPDDYIIYRRQIKGDVRIAFQRSKLWGSCLAALP